MPATSVCKKSKASRHCQHVCTIQWNEQTGLWLGRWSRLLVHGFDTGSNKNGHSSNLYLLQIHQPNQSHGMSDLTLNQSSTFALSFTRSNLHPKPRCVSWITQIRWWKTGNTRPLHQWNTLRTSTIAKSRCGSAISISKGTKETCLFAIFRETSTKSSKVSCHIAHETRPVFVIPTSYSSVKHPPWDDPH